MFSILNNIIKSINGHLEKIIFLSFLVRWYCLKIAKNELVVSKIVNNIVKVDDVYRNKKKENIENLNNEKYFGRIIIDKINVDYMVLNNYSEENLNISICKFLGDKDSNNISIIGGFLCIIDCILKEETTDLVVALYFHLYWVE